MNSIVKEFINFLESECKNSTKEKIKLLIQKKFDLTKDRSIYFCDYFACRISSSKNNSFGNTVLSLSALQKYDKLPVISILVKGNGHLHIMLMNTTFLKKISHSSQDLSMTNIKGSFNGTDIMTCYDKIENCPNNFEILFAIHEAFSWKENLERLVESTSNIKPISQKFKPNTEQLKLILQSIERAKCFINSNDFNLLKNDLDNRVVSCAKEILIASHIENVNIRGRLIEALITSDEAERKLLLSDMKNLENKLPSYDTKNGLGDYVREFKNEKTYTDIKTKVMYLNSNPKAFNIDKFLECMAEDNSVFLFLFVGISETNIVNTVLCSVYHSELLDYTILQSHWAGRATRGVAQYNGKELEKIILEKKFENNTDVDKAKHFLIGLLDR